VLLELAAWLQAGEDRAITAGSQADVKTGCPCLRAVAPGARSPSRAGASAKRGVSTALLRSPQWPPVPTPTHTLPTTAHTHTHTHVHGAWRTEVPSAK
jgi:hypothetical protein